jgi:hypothetical protein
MEADCTLIQLSRTFTTINPQEARLFKAKPIVSKWVMKRKYHANGSIQYKSSLLINGYEKINFRETYAPVEELTTFW